jgi:hypothetical protein
VIEMTNSILARNLIVGSKFTKELNGEVFQVTEVAADFIEALDGDEVEVCLNPTDTVFVA